MSKSLFMRIHPFPFVFILLIVFANCRKAGPVKPAITNKGDTLYTAKAYLNYIVGEQLKIREESVRFGQLIKSEKTDSLLPGFERFADTAQSVLLQVRQLKPFDQDTILYPAAMHLFRYYDEMVQTRLFQFLTHISKTGKFDRNDKTILSYIKEIKQREKAADSIFAHALNRFTLVHQIND
jgi:hypothetical protein